MAYITKSTFSLLMDSVEDVNNESKNKKIPKEIFLEHIYNNELLYSLLTQFQIDKLYKSKIFLSSDENVNLGEIFKFKCLKTIPDPRNTVFYKGKEGGTYHLYKDCETLNSNYVDFFIPQEIQDLDKLFPESIAVDIFRNWFEGVVYEQIENKAEIDKEFAERYDKIIKGEEYLSRIIDLMDFQVNNEILILRYNTYIVELFKEYKDNDGECIVKKLNSDYKLVEQKLPNSGVHQIEDNFNIEIEVEKILQERNELCQPQYYGKQLYDLSFFSYCYNKEYDEIYKRIENYSLEANNYKNLIENLGGIENIRVFWKKHHQLSQKAFNILTKHFLKMFDLNNKEFSSEQLEQYNIHCCGVCKKRIVVENRVLTNK